MEESIDRLERILALILVQQAKTQRDKVAQLNIAGFTNTEIADLLQTTSNVVGVALYETRKGKTKQKKKKKPGGA